MLSAVGTLLLLLPMASTVPLAWHEALFTATSAVTVTGLVVVDTSQLTLFGQLVVLGLIQLGGLGFMTFAALTLVLLGMRLPLQQQRLIRESFNQTSFSTLAHLVRLVIGFALIAETLGTLLLVMTWIPRFGLWEGLWVSVFHAISAFNNAGFSTWPDSLTDEVANPLVNGVVSALFVIGGLGFVVIAELVQLPRQRSLSLNSRIVLHATLWLMLVAMGSLLLLEWNNPATLGGLDSIGTRLQAAWFQAVTPRTAGFNTLDTSELTTPTALLTMLWMFIGAGSSSTASGIKVTTFVVLLLVARAFVAGRPQPAIFWRAIPETTAFKAVAVALAGMLLIFLCLFVMTINEPEKPFLALAFEAVSAFGTVGLSRGVTSELSVPSQLAVIVTMLLGRAGPITLGFFITTRQRRGLKYAEENVQIG
ncbi:TrkH family potassium uptake protein [Litchfieldella rifensis]|uniref:TrkH family potassium uptake protein n=1 Tax=Litchfieldella rifensis TaxID=762643 RepID=A0ABV7LW70_9GAMM